KHEAAVAWRLLHEIVGSNDTAGTRHVLHHNRGLALDRARKSFGHDATEKIGAAAGCKSDQDPELLALIERHLRSRRTRQRDCGSRDRSDNGQIAHLGVSGRNLSDRATLLYSASTCRW